MKRYAALLVLIMAFLCCQKPGKVNAPNPNVEIKSWYALKIGESLNLNENDSVLRVPGGWVIRMPFSYAVACCFIPYTKED
jgi:hypothetical protein